jgi:hypothetical protein
VGDDKNERGKFTSTGGAAGKPRKAVAAGFLAKQRQERQSNRGMDFVIEWAAADSGKLVALIDRATAAHCTITFAVTRDGSALKCSLYDGTDRLDEYCRSTEDLEVFLDMLLELFSGV